MKMDEVIRARVDEIYPTIVRLRRKIHENPELGKSEFATSKLVADSLRSYGLEVKEGYAGTGVVGVLKGKMAGPTIAFRADMDALSIKEANTFEFASKVNGAMHACGHDGHTAALLGTAYILSKMKDEIAGNVKFIFQPDEEGGGGASQMIVEDVLDNPDVDMVFGAHIWNEIPSGKIGLTAGPLFALSDRFDIVIKGDSGHAGYPHRCCDAIVVAAHVVTALQQIVSRALDPVQPAVISIGTINGGYRSNVVADEVTMKGTVRAFDVETREKIVSKMERIVKNTTEAFGASYEFKYIRRYPVLVNSPGVTSEVTKIANELFDEKNVDPKFPKAMAGEDFGYFLKEVPGTFVLVGGAKTDGTAVYPHHHPLFDFDEESMKMIMELFCGIVFHYGEKMK